MFSPEFQRKLQIEMAYSEIAGLPWPEMRARLAAAIQTRNPVLAVEWQWLGSAVRLPLFDWVTFY